MEAKMKPVPNTYDDAFFLIDEQMPIGKPIDWDDVCRDYFGFEMPNEEEVEERPYYVYMRNAYKKAINARAQRLYVGWRLNMWVKSESVIKQEKSEMVETETTERIKRVAGAFRLISDNLRPMLGVKDMRAKDKKIIHQMLAVASAGAFNVQSSISQMSSLNKGEKRQLMSLLEVLEDGEDSGA